MKKIFTLAMLAVAAMTASAQEFNLFPAYDCDAEGWLWLNTQEKIDKYVGTIDEENYTVDPNGKIIQMAFANITPEYPETYADPEVLGVDTEGYFFTDEGVKSEEIIKGAIVLAPSSAQNTANGGCLILNLPSCATISLYLTSEARMVGRTLMITPGYDMGIDDSTGENAWTGHTKSIYARTAAPFSQLHSAGHYKWEGVESLNNGYNEGITFKSDGPVYFALQNCHKYPVFIHAIRVTTPKQETTGIATIPAASAAGTAAHVYNLAGQRVKTAAKGIFIQNGRKIAAK